MRSMAWVMCGTVVLSGALVVAAEAPPASYVNLMKTAGGTMQSIGKNVEAKSYDAIAADATALQKVFQEVGKFWTERKVDDALAACRATFQAAAALEKAAKAKDDEGIAASRKQLGGGCQSCHAAHRDKAADGSFVIK